MPLTGTWRVHFSARSDNGGPKANIAYIYHNEKEIVETSYYTYGIAPMATTGGREVTLDASAGDTISLRTRQFENTFNRISIGQVQEPMFYRILICFEYKAV